MKKFTRSYNTYIYSGQIFDLYHGGLKPCIFDIETTGLSAQRGNKIILTACLIPNSTGVTITQFLAENPYEEDRVIMATMDFLKDESIDYLITYNGASFDIPFMKQRLATKNLPYVLNMYEFDLYNFIRSNTGLKSQIGSLSQKNVEQHFGISSNRKDVISGRESVKLFAEYAINQDSVIEKIILTHNREDVLQLCHLFNIIGRNNFGAVLGEGDNGCDGFNGAGIHDVNMAPIVSNHRLDAALAQTGAGLPSAGGELTARPRLAAGCLTVAGRQLRAPHKLSDDTDFAISANFFPETASSISAEFIKENCSYQIRVPLEKHENSQFLDIKKMLLDAESSGDNTQIKCANSLKGSDNLINDYLLLVNEGSELNREINLLSILISTQLYRTINPNKSNC
ncbi:MAG: ribonuclease H-like domain-containing protein [Mogibacterium diversum]|uniref:ribonuclease H-like domain-containing protein n=1 Tax=Mogibacterium diversum TaxID=114527 RepID=UPI0020639473|nr:ribonuclease H-like domain-containing protein [Mogibacterium diversum]UQF81952.1 MAG: ribonuclease H-like domain-containing protein [Mogibacterium diversum]